MIVLKVPVIESERGWGSKVDDYMICLSTKDAMNFIQEFNAKNTDTVVPDWYMYADFNISPIEITEQQFNLISKEEKSRIWLSVLNKK